MKTFLKSIGLWSVAKRTFLFFRTLFYNLIYSAKNPELFYTKDYFIQNHYCTDDPQDKIIKDAQAEFPLGNPLNKPSDIGSTVVHLTQPLDRPETLKGHTYKVRWPDSDHAMYITINDVIQDGRERPFEVFINSKNMEHFAWTVALTRMISAVFRRGGDISFVVEELKAVFDPRGGQWVGGRYVPSLLAAIGEVIERHLVEIGFIHNPDDDLLYLTEPERKVVNLAKGDDHHPAAANNHTGGAGMRFCPKCNQPSLIKQEGCDSCTSCGYSKCG